MSEEIAAAIGDIAYWQQRAERAEADNAALLGILRDLDYTHSPERAQRLLDHVRESEHPGRALMADITAQLAAARASAPLLERLASLLTAARAYRDAWAGCSFAMGPLAIGVRWERLKAAIDAMDEKE